jgi:hypothetical protein
LYVCSGVKPAGERARLRVSVSESVRKYETIILIQIPFTSVICFTLLQHANIFFISYIFWVGFNISSLAVDKNPHIEDG